MDALFDEPLVGQRVGLAHAAQDLGLGHAHTVEAELRVAIDEGVGVVGVADDRQTRRVVVDEEERRPTLFALDGQGVEDHEVAVVGPGHEPLLAVEHPLAGGRVTHGGRLDRASVGPGAGLGDGIAARALAAQARLEVAPALLRIAVHEDVVGIGHEGPQAAGHLAVLLVDDDLLGDRPALAAVLARERATREPGLDAQAPELARLRRRQSTTGAFDVALERLQDLDHEAPRALAQGRLGRSQGELHGLSLRPARCPWRALDP